GGDAAQDRRGRVDCGNRAPMFFWFVRGGILPGSRELHLPDVMLEAGIRAVRTASMRVRCGFLSRSKHGARENLFVLGDEIRRLPRNRRRKLSQDRKGLGDLSRFLKEVAFQQQCDVMEKVIL